MTTIQTCSTLPGIGIFGCGQWTSFVVHRLRSYGFIVEAIWDSKIDKASIFSKALKIPFHTNEIDTLLLRKHVGLVVILCQQNFHSEIVTKAFRIGKHVICNWPSIADIYEISRMCSAALYYPSLQSGIFYPLRFLPQFDLMRDLLLNRHYVGRITLIQATINGRQLADFGLLIEQHKTQEINLCNQCAKMRGDLTNKQCINTSVQSRLNSQYEELMSGGGMLTKIGPHLIDVISYVSNLRAKRVHGTLRTFNNAGFPQDAIKRITVEDYCHFEMEMQSRIRTEEMKQNKENEKCRVRKSECNPLAIVTMNNHVQRGYASYELLVAGEHGYIRLQNEQLFGRQYERNNNHWDREKVEEAYKEEVLYEESNKEQPDSYKWINDVFCSCNQTEVKTTEINQNGSSTEKSPKPVNSQKEDQISGYKTYAMSMEALIQELPGLFEYEEKDCQTSEQEVKCKSRKLKKSNRAATFEDGVYVKNVIEALRASNSNREWIRIQNPINKKSSQVDLKRLPNANRKVIPNIPNGKT